MKNNWIWQIRVFEEPFWDFDNVIENR